MELQNEGAHNINLVTATQYLPQIMNSLDSVRDKLHIPVVYNCGGYETVETIKSLEDYVDIFLPDFKYFSPELSLKYSGAENYFKTAAAAIKQMIRQTGDIVYDKNGIMQKGVIIRHLVIPCARGDSIKILNWINDNLPKDKFLLSLMSQFTPVKTKFKELNRRITSIEYNSVVDEAIKLGLTNGYMQEKSSAREEYTPAFDLEGV